MMPEFYRGEKIQFDGKTYDFGYCSQVEGYCVLYEEGESNMQDSIAVNMKDVKKQECPPDDPDDDGVDWDDLADNGQYDYR